MNNNKELWIDEAVGLECVKCGYELSLHVTYCGDKNSPSLVSLYEVCPDCFFEEQVAIFDHLRVFVTFCLSDFT